MAFDLDQLLKDSLAQQNARARDKKSQIKRATALRSEQDDLLRRQREKARIKKLLEDDRFDGMRFRFYFQNREGKDLDQWRREIDTLMNTVTKVKLRG